MKLIAFFAAIATLFANLPLIYNILYVHKFEGVKTLWGYAPNAMFFYLIPFPAAVFSICYALYIIIPELKASDKIDLGGAFGFVLHNWLAVLLFATALGSCAAAIDFLSGTRTFDKLKAPLALKAAQSASELRTSVIKFGERKAHKEILKAAYTEMEEDEVYLKQATPEKRFKILLDFPPEKFLLFTQDIKYQQSLQLLDEPLNALTVFQTYLLITTLITTIIATALWHWGVQHIGLENIPQTMWLGHRALYTAICSISLYPLLYWVQHTEVQMFTLHRPSLMPHVVIPFILTVLLLLICYAERHAFPSLPFVLRYVSIPIVVGASIKNHSLVSSIVGSQASFGMHVLLILVFLLIYSLIAVGFQISHNSLQ